MTENAKTESGSGESGSVDWGNVLNRGISRDEFQAKREGKRSHTVSRDKPDVVDDCVGRGEGERFDHHLLKETDDGLDVVCEYPFKGELQIEDTREMDSGTVRVCKKCIEVAYGIEYPVKA